MVKRIQSFMEFIRKYIENNSSDKM